MSILIDIVEFLEHWVWSVPSALPWLVAVLLLSGFYVTVRLRFIQLRELRHAFRIVLGKYDNPRHKGDISHFQALSTALSATVGIGNIAGVATAIHLGGPGALFWMWVTAVFGMALKYSECTMSMLYRDFDERGNAAGGPMYYIEKGLGRRWKPLAILFACFGIIASFGSGNMNQANTVSDAAHANLGISKYVVAFVVAAIVASVILGGIKRIGMVSSKLAPAMAVLYVIGALTVLLLHIGDVPAAFATIFHDAFNPRASLGGSIAGGWMTTLVWGVKRGLFSNEAGQGSAPIAHAAAKTDEPVREGAVAMLGPLIDTLIICTMTGLVIVVTGVWDEKHALADVDDATIVATANLQASAQQSTAYARLRAAEAAEERLAEGDPTTISVAVERGRQTALAFIVNDGLLDDPILSTREGELFTGTLRYDRTKRALYVGDVAADLRLSGRGLETGAALTSLAFKRGLSGLGDWGNYIVVVCVFLFAISTMISWSYYGDRCVVYLFGYRWVKFYRSVFVTFTFIGAILALDVVWAYGDVALGLMTVPNLIGVIFLTPKVAARTRDYFQRMRAEGKR